MTNNIETLDSLFSEYVRLRDSDQYGMIRCISCGKRVKWQYADAGHFVSRKHMSLRFDEANCHSQCCFCNRFKSGNLKSYKRGLKIKLGRYILDYLENKKQEVVKYSDFELELLVLNYKKKIKELRKLKMI